MNRQNVENILNLALDATEEERIKSRNLNVGYDQKENIWELIIKYSGTLEGVRMFAVSVVTLRGGYAIVQVKEGDIQRLSEIRQIEYIEKPKRLFFQTENGRRVSCINEVQNTRFLSFSDTLFGNGVLVAILDSGIDYRNLDFRNEDGSTRIYRLWDQTIEGNPPEGYALGTVYTREQIDEAIMKNDENLVPSRDMNGHGTAVAGIAAGNGSGGGSLVRGVAPQSELLIVKLGKPSENGFPRTTELMQALNYVVDISTERGMPLAVNLSIGNTYGAHNGTSLLERFMDEISNVGKTTICVGAGNEGTSAGHVSIILVEDKREEVLFFVQENQIAFNIQMWKRYEDHVQIRIVSPSGGRSALIDEVLGTQRLRVEETEILLYYGEPSPYSVLQEIYMEFLPVGCCVAPGIWRIEIFPERIVDGEIEMWMPSESTLNVGTAFLYPSEELTITIPATAERMISVGAYQGFTGAYAPFSGRGYHLGRGRVKPDLVAPGVDIVTSAVGGGNVSVTGTSFAVPFVTGSAALLMEWGSVKGNDPFLYGEKVKAYLRDGARQLAGYEKINAVTGYGALCLKESLP